MRTLFEGAITILMFLKKPQTNDKVNELKFFILVAEQMKFIQTTLRSSVKLARAIMID